MTDAGPTVTIVNTGIANTASVAAAFTRLGATVELTDDPRVVYVHVLQFTTVEEIRDQVADLERLGGDTDALAEELEKQRKLEQEKKKQAEAERERRAKVIHAVGESEAAEKLAEAAQVLSHQDQAIQLRYLQTLVEIAADKNSTIVFPVPVDMMEKLKSVT